MPVLTIAKMGNPILARIAAKIEDPAAPRWAALVEDMKETMAAAGGVGLAAPQVEVDAQLVIFSVPVSRSEEGGLPLSVLINPEITPLSEETADGYEACLSVPGLTGIVPRWTHIHYRGLDLAGQVIEREARGFHARVVQHECDHLWGRLYISRMTSLSSLAYRDELARLAAAKEDL
ncbi:MAG TPA: peptide deformylase [Magnetospirillaceae bacterium]|nr:peptide deformylase [Magnetospirillaceae bacterium]